MSSTTKTFGIYSNNPRSNGFMLAFGPSEAECRAKLIRECGDGADDDCEIVEVTKALAASIGEMWTFLPGSDGKIGCTHEEALDAEEAK